MGSRLEWDEYFMKLAKNVASRSKDRSTKVGAVIVGPDREIRSTGYNGFARGVDDEPDCRHERHVKLMITPHAEVNAILNAARVGISTRDCAIYVTLHPCALCAASIINAGIKEVVIENTEVPERWEENRKWAITQFEEANVLLRLVNETRNDVLERRWAEKRKEKK